MSATLLGFLFVLGALTSGVVAYLKGVSLVGTIAKATTVSFLLLAVAAFLI